MITATATLTETISVTASLGGSVCLSATYTLVDTDVPPNTLDSGSIASGAAETIVAPAASVTVNSSPFGTAPSGGALDVPVVNGGSNPVGVIQSGQVVIGNNATFINGVQVTDQEAEVNANIAVELDGNPSGTWNAGLQTWEVTSSPTTPKTTAKLMKTGQTVSYVTGDDGDLERGRSVDFLTLAENNYFGNTNRFTDTLGGQTYTNNIVLDWSTFEEASGDVMGYFRVLQGAATWATAISNCLAFTAGSFVSGWYLPNVVELLSIMNFSKALYLTYGPFSIGGSFLNSSTTYPAATAQSWMIVGNASTPLTVRTKSVATSYIPVRRFNISEL